MQTVSDIKLSKSESSKYLYLILLFSPLLALIIALFSFRTRVSRSVVFIVLVLYGLTMSFFGDGVGEANKFIYWSKNTFQDLMIYLKGLYFSGANVDFVQQILMYLTSRITNDPSIYFGVVAAVFALFYLKSCERIYDHHNLFANQNSLIFFWFFFMLQSIFYISGSRWAIAAWIYFYAVYHFLMFKEWKYALLAIVPVFVHFSFFGPIIIFFCFVFLGRKNSIYYALVVASFFLQFIASTSLSQIETNSFVGVQERVSIYNNEDEVVFRQEISQDLAWYVKYPREIIWIYLSLGIFFGRKMYRSSSKDLWLETLYSFCLLLFALANSFLKIPSGGRFRIIFFMFATLYLIVLFAKVNPKGLSRLTLVGLLPMVLYFMVEFRRGLDALNIGLAAPLPVSFITNVNLF